MPDPIQTVPLAAFEAQGERSTRIIAHMAIGWCISVIVLAIVLLFAISVDYETVEEVVTTTTETTDVAQHADNSGSNYYAGGDMSNGGNADGQDGQDNTDQNNEDNNS